MDAKTYCFILDGPLFREQRAWLLAQESAMSASGGAVSQLRGLINLTDAIADQAYDNYGIDCLLTEVDEVPNDQQ